MNKMCFIVIWFSIIGNEMSGNTCSMARQDRNRHVRTQAIDIPRRISGTKGTYYLAVKLNNFFSKKQNLTKFYCLSVFVNSFHLVTV